MRTTVILAVSCLCVALLPSTGARAADPEIVEQALRAMEAADLDRWAFVETAVQNGTTIVQHHDPTRLEGDRWTVVSVDGREPTEAERDEYTNREPAGDDGDDESDNGEIRAMISPDSVTLIEETPTHLVFSFDPSPENEEDARFYRHVDATLRIARGGPHLESLEMRSREPFSPQFGVKLREFTTVMTFGPVGDRGDVLPRTVRVRMLGRAMLFKKIDESVEVSYSEYRLPSGS